MPNTMEEMLLEALYPRLQAKLAKDNPHGGGETISEDKIREIVNQILTNQNIDPDKLVQVDQYNQHLEIIKSKINEISADMEARAGQSDKMLFAKLDEEIRDLKNRTPKEIIIKVQTPENPEGKIIQHGQHASFHYLLRLISSKIPIYMHGPTGSGKTTAVYTAGTALGLPVYRKVLSRETGQHELFGYMDANGHYVPGVFYKPFVEGGICLVDEVDNGNPNTNVAIKMLQDTEECWFPCGVMKRHPNYRLVANANTIGNGANSQYVGRNQQDKAFLNIFSFLQWDYDEAFEYSICWNEYASYGGEDKDQFDRLIQSFRAVRQAIVELQINHILSPRNLKDASRMFALKFEPNIIAETVVWRGMEAGQREKVEGKVKSNRKGGLQRVNSLWDN